MNINIKRLIECRNRLGISKQEAAKRIGVSQPTYLRYESGDRNPSIHIIKAIAEVFNTSIEYLTGETESSASDFVVINKKNDPDLFQIIYKYKNMDAKQINQLQEYIKLLSHRQDTETLQ